MMYLFVFIIVGLFYIITAVICLALVTVALIALTKIIKNKKNLNYIFKISDKHKTRDTIQIFVQLFVIIPLIFIGALLHTKYNNDIYESNTTALTKAKNTLNVLLLKLEKNNNSFLEQIETSEELAYILALNLQIQENEELAKAFHNKPTFQTTDGIIYSITKYKKGCKYVNRQFIKTSDCLITVDSQGLKKPNKLNADRILFAIDGTKNEIITSKKQKI